MARRPDGEERLRLPPKARPFVGWVAAAVIIVGVAVVVGLLGGNADGTAVVPTATPSPSAAQAAEEIRFGTALDPATQEVAADAETDRFLESDMFAYSFRPTEAPPTTVWVEVRRNADGSGEAVQPPAPHGLAEDAMVVAFQVPAANLFADFGPGEYQMRITLEEDGAPVATGSFELVTDPVPSPSD